MTTPDFRALCAELVDDLEVVYDEIEAIEKSHDLIERVHAALAAEPVVREVHFEFAVVDGDCMQRAGGTALTYAHALSEGRHYLAQRLQDGPHTLEIRRIEQMPLAQPEPETLAEALAARPLLEKVARLDDCIGQQTVGQVQQLARQAAAWLRGNPPGQPVAIEPRGCPAPGACSCVEPTPPAPEVVAPVPDSEMSAYNHRAVARFAILDRLEKVIDFNSYGWQLTPKGEQWTRLMSEQGQDEYEMGL
jgi:hypothetical protein